MFYSIPTAKSAEKISLSHGLFSRTITIKSLNNLIKTGEAKGTLKNLIEAQNIPIEEIINVLNQEFELPLVVTSKLINSTIGEVILFRLTKIIYPKKLPNKTISIPAMRAGVINGIVVGNGKLTLIQFLNSYPNKTIEVNMSALFNVLNKVESMSELIDFYVDSPLERMKKK